MTLSLPKGNRGLRSRAVKRIEKKIIPCAAGSRAAAPIKLGLGLLGRKAAERAQEFLCRICGAGGAPSFAPLVFCKGLRFEGSIFRV